LIDDRVPLVVIALANQPAKDVTWIHRISDARFRRAAINSEHVVLRNRAPMRLAVADTRPSFDAREQPFNPRPVALDHVAVSRLFIINQATLLVTNPASVEILFEDRYEILCARDDEDIRFLGVAVLRQALVCLSSDGRQREIPTYAKRTVAGT